MAAPVGRDTLPEHWSYGVCRDGRVFFINDETRTTTWLHPRSGEPVNSGHMIRSDLPPGWEEGFTDEGASFFINHNQRATAFHHPVTRQISPENLDFLLQEQPQGAHIMSKPVGEQLSSTTVSEASTTITSSTVDTTSASKGSRSSGKVHSFGKREQAIKRNPNVPVVVRGWLYKQDSSGMRLWKRKWFVLADFCLFYYKDSREESVLGSIPLPSYVISTVGPEDHINRKYAFKASHTGMRSYIYKQSSVIGSQAEHSGMRTYYFSADTQEDMNTWLKAMNLATLMRNHTDTFIRPSDNLDKLHILQQQAVPQTNHVNHHKTKTSDSDITRPIVHEVLLEPIHRDAEDHCSFRKDSPATTVLEHTTALEMDTHTSLPSNPTPSALSQSDHMSASAPVSRVPSRAPSRAASTLPSSVGTRNGLVETPSPHLEPNGIATGTYQRTPPLSTADTHKQVHRRSTLEQVEQWVKVQKAEHKGPPSRDNTLPRRTPPTQHKFTTIDAYQTLPKTPRQSPPPARLGEYKYAQDRLSHFRLAPDQSVSGANTVWQLYEWQQRHQFRHGSPTAPLYNPAPDYPFGPRPPSTVPPFSSAPRSEGPPRCVSVPPSPADIPPPGPPPGFSRTLSPTRRPHTPADRVTVRPVGGRTVVDSPFTVSPRRTKSQLFKTANIERRSLPPSGYITHTVSAPSLHGKTADDTYMQLKKDLDYLDLKVTGSQTMKESGKPVKVAESDVDVKLSRLCEQDKILKDLEARISSLKDDKDKLESVLDMAHQQMEQFQDQSAHANKIAYQQRLLQEDLVTIRAQISRLSTEMAYAWEEYSRLERSVEQLRTVLRTHMNHSATPQQEKAEMKRELWRIEDVMAGLSASKANYQVTIDSVQNPERKLVPSVSDLAVPSHSAEVQPPPRSCVPRILSHTLPHSTVPKWAEDSAPPRPPLPLLYDYEETPPVVPPLPKEASVIRHTSVRGLKRQSDERKRDRETGQYVVNGDCKADLRSYLSEPELPGTNPYNTGSDTDYQYFSGKDLSGSSSQLNQSNSISSYVTLRRGPRSSGAKSQQERPKSALECLSSPTEATQLTNSQTRGRMTAEEQLERMKRHQRALVRERKRNLSQGERSNPGLSMSTNTTQRSSSSSRMPSGSSEPPASEERRGAEGQKERVRFQPDEWMKLTATYVREVDIEPLDYDLDISLELAKPRKVPIPERYVESEPEEPASPEELEERSRRAERIKNILAKSSVQNIQQSASLDFSELDSALKQQERIMNVSHTLASEASRKSKLVAAKAAAEH
ncbi:pleckstrin-likey domain-containing family A member 7-like isoform X1 [Solea senegalensis]|uniref:Pleckstrin-likey domain-containing family A member 7-like isoform X1 n=2 Tax=Solea senegalensis TaxID=28829 RepID=A0AAV6T0H9_SOLSE|nr:pleckstrin homology domain-containing family A member 7-like isoform X5 [Solea senegalensis]KAG7522873.1 pleckstrin-likey domain-containing family A member 7-like isoform X1 [Solea senegalensis]